MNVTTLRSAFLLACITLLLPLQAKAAEAETNDCATSQCHPTLVAKEPALPKGHGDCSHCHQKVGKENTHPEAGTKSFSFKQEVCEECHQTVVDYSYLHPPVAAGDCLACHTFHSNATALLTEPADHVVCYNCHQPVTKEGDTELHGDVAEYKCTACHPAHGSFFNHLLAGPYSTEFFNDYNEKQYALCFQCHKIDLLLHANTSYNTNFRDGKKNLHYIHVNRETRGRSCKLCHVVHAGRQPKLMAEKVSFGDWEMPINFISTVNGGQCAPGCHAPAAYDRNRIAAPGLPSRSPNSAPE